MHGITDTTREKLNLGAKCELYDPQDMCRGRLTVSHPLKYQSRQVKEPWAEVISCSYHHAVDEWQDSGNYNEEKHQKVALNKATDAELEAYPKSGFITKRDRLNKKYAS